MALHVLRQLDNVAWYWGDKPATYEVCDQTQVVCDRRGSLVEPSPMCSNLVRKSNQMTQSVVVFGL